jgi:hypothetical protein
MKDTQRVAIADRDALKTGTIIAPRAESAHKH